MGIKPEPLIVQCADQDAWREWLEANHTREDGVWLKFAKKTSPTPTVTYDEALEEALCYGWIDGQSRGLDDHFYLQRFTPRRRRSKWSRLNRERATRLIEAGRMSPAGLAQVEAAQSDGRWDAAYEPQSQATVPPDFQRALDANPKAAAFFATLTGSARYAFLYRLHHTTAAARRERMDRYVELLASEKTL